MKGKIVIGICFIWSFSLVGQDYSVVPTQFMQFYQNYSLINPSFSGIKNGLKVNVGHTMIASIFEGVNTSYGGAEFSIGNDSMEQKHGFALNLMNSREGPYFNRGRIYLQYAYHNRLSFFWKYSAGFSAGIVNHSYKATDLFPARSVTKPIVDIGLSVYRPEFLMGVGFHQVIRQTMQPLELNSIVQPYFSYTVDYRYKVFSDVEINPITTWRFSKAFVNGDAALLLRLKRIVTIGAHYKALKGYALSGGIDTESDFAFSLYVLYYVPFVKSGNIRPQTLEFTSTFCWKRKR